MSEKRKGWLEIQLWVPWRNTIPTSDPGKLCPTRRSLLCCKLGNVGQWSTRCLLLSEAMHLHQLSSTLTVKYFYKILLQRSICSLTGNWISLRRPEDLTTIPWMLFSDGSERAMSIIRKYFRIIRNTTGKSHTILYQEPISIHQEGCKGRLLAFEYVDG